MSVIVEEVRAVVAPLSRYMATPPTEREVAETVAMVEEVRVAVEMQMAEEVMAMVVAVAEQEAK